MVYPRRGETLKPCLGFQPSDHTRNKNNCNIFLYGY